MKHFGEGGPIRATIWRQYEDRRWCQPMVQGDGSIQWCEQVDERDRTKWRPLQEGDALPDRRGIPRDGWLHFRVTYSAPDGSVIDPTERGPDAIRKIAHVRVLVVTAIAGRPLPPEDMAAEIDAAVRARLDEERDDMTRRYERWADATGRDALEAQGAIESVEGRPNVAVHDARRAAMALVPDSIECPCPRSTQ